MDCFLSSWQPRCAGFGDQPPHDVFDTLRGGLCSSCDRRRRREQQAVRAGSVDVAMHDGAAAASSSSAAVVEMAAVNDDAEKYSHRADIVSCRVRKLPTSADA